METALFTVVICGFAGIIGVAIYFGRRIYAEFVAFGTNVQHNTFVIDNKTGDVLSIVEEIKEILTEASRLKAMRESGKTEPLPPRAPVRQRAFTGIAQRRAQAESASLKGKTHTEQVRTNDVRAMEGK